MDAQKGAEQLTNCVNVLILLMIALVYVVTGTGVGDDAIAALSNGTIYRGRPNGSVAIECAVAWDAENLAPMLDTLRESNTHITFFVSGKWAKDHANTLERMVSDGHEIGTLGYAPLLDGDVDTVFADIEASSAAIRRVTGETVESYQSGLRDRRVSARAAQRAGLSHVAATADLLCGQRDAEEIVARACEQAFDGSILMIQPTAAAAQALPKLLSEIWSLGYRTVTVGEVLKGTSA